MVERIEEALTAMASDSSEYVREAVLSAIDRVRARRSIDRFRALLKEGNLEEKIHVIYVAEEMGGGEGVALLLEALSDREDEVRGAAVRSLKSFLTPTVLKALWEMLSKESGIVLGNIVEALGTSGRKELSPHVDRYLAHPDVEVRAKAIVASSRLTNAAGWEKILAMREDPDENIRVAVAQGLGNWTVARP